MENSRNYDFWNIVKGIGMLCIVVGHSFYSFPYAVRFVYLFHLAVFFFVSGFFYSEIKYGDKPLLYCKVRLQKLWIQYVSYMLFYVAMHNFFLQYGIIINTMQYGFGEALRAIVFTLALNGYESMGGALWFVPVMLVASCGFGFIVYAGRKVEAFTKCSTFKNVLIILLTCLLGIVGVYANIYGKFCKWHLQTSLLVIPLYTMAWGIRTYVKHWMKYLHWLPLTIVIGMMFYGIFVWEWQIELARNMICGPLAFYAISAMGIYVVLCTAKYISQIPLVNWIFASAGKYSFDIMAGHFLVLKLIDLMYAGYIGETDTMVFGAFPCAYSKECWILYGVFAFIMPVVFRCCLNRVCRKLTTYRIRNASI